jgi:hypothetical protein
MSVKRHQGGHVEGHKIQAQGRLERAGSTKYEYGSHALFPPGRRDIQYILRSDSVQLREYEGQNVQVTGSLVEDAPLDEGDPKLLDVFTVRPLFEGSDGSLR